MKFNQTVCSECSHSGRLFPWVLDGGGVIFALGERGGAVDLTLVTQEREPDTLALLNLAM